MSKRIAWKKPFLALLGLTFLAQIVFFTDWLSVAPRSISKGGFVEEDSTQTVSNGTDELVAVNQELMLGVMESLDIFYNNDSSGLDQNSANSVYGSMPLLKQESSFNKSIDHKSRVLSTTTADPLQSGGKIVQLTSGNKENHSRENKEKGNKSEKEIGDGSKKTVFRKLSHSSISNVQNATLASNDAKVKQLKDQLIRAKVYLSASATRTNPQYIRQLLQRVRDIQRVLGDATKDSELPKSASEKLKAMEQVLATGKQIHNDCSDAIKKLRAIVQSAEDQLRAQQKQTLFLAQLAAKTVPKGLHCLSLRLSNEYFLLEPKSRQFLNQEKLEDPSLHHYALFSDNVLAVAVVVNSTVINAKEPQNHVFHVITDRLNYAAMRMWFLANPPGKASIQIQSVEEFTWLNSSYSPVLKQLESMPTIDYYFKAKRASSDPNLKYRNPKYLSILNHLRFYLLEIFPKLNKVVFLDDDVVVQKDLSGLWKVDMKGKVIGAVETCGENFHRFDKYLNFSNPLIAKNFDPHACGWAFGMNLLDLSEWRRQNITEIYHFWQRRNEERRLWKLGTLPPGLITFYGRVLPLDHSWHVLGLGYNPNVNAKQIERAAVIHYNGNMKPWLEIGLPRYAPHWSKYLNHDQPFLRECNIHP